MITGIQIGFVLICANCRSWDMTNLHFNKPKELFLECLRCNIRQALIYDAKAAKEPTTKIQRARFNKRFKN